MADLRFDDKIVLVTGASRGIGRACAVAFAARGARMAIHYRTDRTAAENTLAALQGTGHFIVQADVSHASEVQAMVEQVTSTMGGLHILVNNAAIYEDHPIAEIDFETWQSAWERIIGANLIGPANLSYCAARHMITAGGGRIVNISSRGAFRGEPTAPAYGASKAGLNAMSQSLAKALGSHRIFVGTVAPGWVATDMANEALAGPMGDYIRNESPLHRIAAPEEIAFAVLFMAADGSEFMTGANPRCEWCFLFANVKQPSPQPRSLNHS